MVNRLHDIIVIEHLPEQPAVAAEAGGLAAPEPLPCVTISQVFGLMEVLRDRGGRMDVFALDKITDYDFGYTLSVVKAGEMFDFLDTPKNLVLLTPLGDQALDADINGRKQLLNQQLRKLGTFQFVIQILHEAKDRQLPRDVVEEELIMRLPTQDVEELMKTVTGWGRFAELFDYDTAGEVLRLIENPPA
jgi:NitT/TauT family transport system ATP-binding protein